MSSFREGDQVVLVRAYNSGWSGKSVPQGTRGRVVKAPFIGGPTVTFSWHSGWSGNKSETVEVDDSAVRRA